MSIANSYTKVLLVSYFFIFFAPHIVKSQEVKGYEFVRDYPLFLEQLKDGLSYPYAWENNTTLSFDAWKSRGRAAVIEAIQKPPSAAVDYHSIVLSTQQRQGYEARKIEFNLTEYSRVPAYLLVPDGEGPFPAVVLLHDHGAHFSIGKEKMVRPFDVDSVVLDDAHKWAELCYGGQFVGDELAANGYVVLVVDALFWGERGRKEGVRYESQQAVAAVFEMLGCSWSGFITQEDIYTVDFVSTLPQVDTERIACMGFSMGGYRAWMLAALSDKIKAGASVCWMTTTEYQLSSQLNKGKGDSNYANILPGIRRFMDYPHIASLAAPKPMLFFNGKRDKLFPIPAVESAYATMRNVWRDCSADDMLITHLWETDHVCNPEMQSQIISFFDYWLK